MHPTLFELGSLQINSYGTIIAFAFFLLIVLAARRSRREEIGLPGTLDLCFWITVGSITASRLFTVVADFPRYWQQCTGQHLSASRVLATQIWDCSRALHFWDGDLVWYGGLFGGIAVSILFCRKRRISFLALADWSVAFVAFGHGLGRIGCFFAGCCYGKRTPSILGVSFPPPSIAFQQMQRANQIGALSATPPLHPTQLYEAVAELCLSAFLFWREGKHRYLGQILINYLTLYPIVRAGIEVFRADPSRQFVVELTTPSLAASLGLPVNEPLFVSIGQATSLLLLGFSLILRARLRRQLLKR